MQLFGCRYCEHNDGEDYCYGKNIKCWSLSNIWYGIFVNPTSKFIGLIRCRFQKCHTVNNGCSFQIFGKYCTYGGECKPRTK